MQCISDIHETLSGVRVKIENSVAIVQSNGEYCEEFRRKRLRGIQKEKIRFILRSISCIVEPSLDKHPTVWKLLRSITHLTWLLAVYSPRPSEPIQRLAPTSRSLVLLIHPFVLSLQLLTRLEFSSVKLEINLRTTGVSHFRSSSAPRLPISTVIHSTD